MEGGSSRTNYDLVFFVCVFERKDTEHSEKASSAVKPQREA